MDESARALFSEGAAEYLVELEEALLHLAEDPDNITEIDRVFRVMHTLKGSAAMVDFNDISEFAHALETEFDYIRRGQAVITPAIIKLTLKSHDILAKMINTGKSDHKKSAKLLDKLRNERLKSSSEEETGGPIKIAIADICEYKAELNEFVSFPENKKLRAAVSRLISRLYYLAIKADLENITEFLSEFELYYRKLRLEGLNSTPEVAQLALDAVEEARRMFEAAQSTDETNMDPDQVMQSLQTALELQQRLVQVQEIVRVSDSPLPPANEYELTICLEKAIPGSPFSTEKDFIAALQRLGDATVIESCDKNDAEPKLVGVEGVIEAMMGEAANE